MKAGEMLATISWRKALAFCFTLLTALCSWPGRLAAASNSVATFTIEASTLQSTKTEHEHTAGQNKSHLFSFYTLYPKLQLQKHFSNWYNFPESIIFDTGYISVTCFTLRRLLPAVVEHVVHYIPGEHVLVDISLRYKEHITQSTCQPAPLPAWTHTHKHL